MIIKKINAAADAVGGAELFSLVEQTFDALNQKKSPELVEAWFLLNYAKICGDEVNLYRDNEGNKLKEDEHYVWDISDESLRVQPNGNIGADEIKIMRLMLTSKLNLLTRVNGINEKIPAIIYIARAINKSTSVI